MAIRSLEPIAGRHLMGEQIFLHLLLTLKSSDEYGSYYFAQTNIDSSTVKGQGKALWSFLIQELSTISQQGLPNLPAIPIVHEVNPNQYSQPLVAADPHYQKKGSAYYGFYA